MKSILNGCVISLLLVLFNVNVSALPAPGYLSVPQWKSCAVTQTKGTAQFWCLPKDKPGNCPSSSWSALVTGRLILNCH